MAPLIGLLLVLSMGAVIAVAPGQQERRLDDGIVDSPYEHDRLYKSDQQTDRAEIDR
ncbi:MAG: hypothetical protein M3395_07030 [Chloroflexota bacterium]|nr:hypothetical protein [Chloroflexota bacterium]